MAEALSALGVENQSHGLSGLDERRLLPRRSQPHLRSGRSLAARAGWKRLMPALGALGGTLYADVAFQNVTLISKRYSRTYESSRYYGAGYTAIMGQVNPALLRRVSALGYTETMYSLLSPKFLSRYVDGFIGATDDSAIWTASPCAIWATSCIPTSAAPRLSAARKPWRSSPRSLQKLNNTGKKLLVSGGNVYALALCRRRDRRAAVHQRVFHRGRGDPAVPDGRARLRGLRGRADQPGRKRRLAGGASANDRIRRELPLTCSRWEDAAADEIHGPEPLLRHHL